MQNCDLLADTHDECGEGPLWDPQTGLLYWIDIGAQRISRLDWSSRTTRTLARQVDVTGIALNEPDGFVLVSSDGIWLWREPDESIAVLRSTADLPLAFNDCLAGPHGRLLAGTCYLNPERSDYPAGKLVSVSENGVLSVLDEGFALANGLGLSPDCRTLYFTDSARREI